MRHVGGWKSTEASLVERIGKSMAGSEERLRDPIGFTSILEA